METELKIHGFKCFINNTFSIKDLTVLCGSNGTGKSSLIQALLLIRSAIEKNADFDDDTRCYDINKWRDDLTPLNQGYELTLGIIDDIFNVKTASGFLDSITITLDDNSFIITIPDGKENDTSADIKPILTSIKDLSKNFWLRKEFYYLNAERLGPRYGLTSNSMDFLHCGYRGEFCAQVLDKGQFLKIPEERRYKSSKGENLPQQLDAWLNSICPGTSVKSTPLGSMSAQIELRNASVNNYISAPNLGFGVSYSLPIIINGLIAKEGSVYIVENPEAHLHPKGQSNIGYFLGKIAVAGVKVIIETHSEHVVNGIRRAVLELDDAIEIENGFYKNIDIYFFDGYDFETTNIMEPILISSTGDLNQFPKDFFDQVQQDMSELFKMQQSLNG